MICCVLDLVKQSKPGVHVKPLEFSVYSENYKLCIVKTYQEYIRRTSKLRGNEQKVFVSTVKPHKAVGKSTLARWIKCIMGNAGINIEQFGAHSCRSASTSSAAVKGLQLDTIIRAAGWKSASTFRKFYLKTIEEPCLSDNFAESILNANSNSKS